MLVIIVALFLVACAPPQTFTGEEHLNQELATRGDPIKFMLVRDKSGWGNQNTIQKTFNEILADPTIEIIETTRIYDGNGQLRSVEVFYKEAE